MDGEVVVFRAPCHIGDVAVTQVPLERGNDVVSSVDMQSGMCFRRRLRFFHAERLDHSDDEACVEGNAAGDTGGEDSTHDAEVVSDMVQSEVVVRYAALPGYDAADVGDVLRGGVLLDTPLCLGYHRAMLAALLLVKAPSQWAAFTGRALLVGAGVGAFARALLAHTALSIDAVDCDAGVVALGQHFFGFGAAACDRVTVRVADGVDVLQVSGLCVVLSVPCGNDSPHAKPPPPPCRGVL
jgi:hypothetical protein